MESLNSIEVVYVPVIGKNKECVVENSGSIFGRVANFSQTYFGILADVFTNLFNSVNPFKKAVEDSSKLCLDDDDSDVVEEISTDSLEPDLSVSKELSFNGLSDRVLLQDKYDFNLAEGYDYDSDGLVKVSTDSLELELNLFKDKYSCSLEEGYEDGVGSLMSALSCKSTPTSVNLSSDDEEGHKCALLNVCDKLSHRIDVQLTSIENLCDSVEAIIAPYSSENSEGARASYVTSICKDIQEDLGYGLSD